MRNNQDQIQEKATDERSKMIPNSLTLKKPMNGEIVNKPSNIAISFNRSLL